MATSATAAGEMGRAMVYLHAHVGSLVMDCLTQRGDRAAQSAPPSVHMMPVLGASHDWGKLQIFWQCEAHSCPVDVVVEDGGSGAAGCNGICLRTQALEANRHLWALPAHPACPWHSFCWQACLARADQIVDTQAHPAVLRHAPCLQLLLCYAMLCYATH